MTGVDIAARLVASGLPSHEAAAKATLFDRVIDALGGRPAYAWWVPGRLEVFGKHTDYAGGRSLVCAVPRGFAVVARPRADDTITATDATGGAALTLEAGRLEPFTGWRQYVATVVRRLSSNFPDARGGADLVFASDLPRASGMSSSSALVVATAAALVRIRGLDRTAAWRDTIGDALAASGYYACVENGAAYGSLAGDAGVGTHGGSEDHAAIVTATPAELSAFSFNPLRLLQRVRLPDHWIFVIATSATRAEKTGAAQGRYNDLAARAAALLALWNERPPRASSLASALAAGGDDAVADLHHLIDETAGPDATADDLHRRLDHFVREDARIPAALAAFAHADAMRLGELAAASQRDAETLLGNQIDETRALASSARALGALAASSFGAGFGGSVWALVARTDADRFARDWHPGAFFAEPAAPLTEYALG